MIPGYVGPAIRFAGDPVHRPVVLTLAGSADATMEAPYSTIADQLVSRGWLSVSLNLPGHGSDARAGEVPDSLTTWRDRMLAGEHLVADFCDKVRAVLDGLLACGASNGRVVLVGISRGGWLAAHLATVLSVAGVVLVIPVTDLRQLEEFAGVSTDLRWAALSLSQAVERLRVPVWMKSMAVDPRVGTSQPFVQALRDASADLTQVVDPGTEHRVLPVSVLTAAAEWIRMLP